MIASSHLVLVYPSAHFLFCDILFYPSSSLPLANILQFLVKFWFTDYHHFYSHLLELQMYLPREDRTISTVWQKKWGGEKEKRIKIKLINRVIYLNWVSSPISLLYTRKFCFLLLFYSKLVNIVGRYGRLLWLLLVLFYLISSLKIMQLYSALHYSTLLSSTLLSTPLYSTLLSSPLLSPLLYSLRYSPLLSSN